MACRNRYSRRSTMLHPIEEMSLVIKEPTAKLSVNRLLFGVDSAVQADILLQNNLEQFEWVVRNKIYPNFYGRYLTGDNSLTTEEIQFLHKKGCKIALICADEGEKKTEEQGMDVAQKAIEQALTLRIPKDVAIFFEIPQNEIVTCACMRGYAKALIVAGYTPGFKANTDAKYTFDRDFSRGMRGNTEVFKKCLVWAVAPSIQEYDGITTSHLIHPDNWKPFAPSCITRRDIAIWQYGKDAHPIEDDAGKLTVFNLNLVRNERVIIEKMF